MSSFSNPHHLYLFEMTNGKQKLGYGSSAEDAYESLRLRLTEKEMQLVIRERCTRIAQRELRQHIQRLG
ncbi:MAG: hypothetical protein HY784_11740 [Chloroflexi bacterium]|nr:hypothetical protein [Chloroflexota bacterium]